MPEIHEFLGARPHRFDPQQLHVRPHESNSHDRHKYPHRQHASIVEAAAHVIPSRIQDDLEKTCPWFYKHFYPGRGLQAQKA